MEKIFCKKCIYYYVTWKPRLPHGCKAYGFESKIIPSIVVFKNSKQQCQFYTQREEKI